MKVTKDRILITGGHASSTIYAFTQEILKSKLSWQLFFVGARSSVEGKKVKTLAEVNFKDSHIRSFYLYTGRLQRKFTRWTIPSLLKIPIGFLHALLILMKIRPKVIVSFGGFVSYPICFWGYVLRVPVIIHEQTPVAGRANLMAKRFAVKIALARESSLKYFGREKSVIIGNPVSRDVEELKPKLKKGDPVNIFIHGGQSGSAIINDNVHSLLPKLLQKYHVTHQTGESEFSKYQKVKNALSEKLVKNYEVVGIIRSREFYRYLKRADIIVSRSGANITSELMFSKKPAILIPLAYSYLNEQELNAKYLQDIGLAKVIHQPDLTAEKLYKEILYLDKNWYEVAKKLKDFYSPDKDASKKLVDLVKKYL